MFFLGVWARGEFPPDFGDKDSASFPYGGAPVVNLWGGGTNRPPKSRGGAGKHWNESAMPAPDR